MEVPRSCKRVRFPSCVVVGFAENGEATEVDEYFDRLDVPTQIGVA